MSEFTTFSTAYQTFPTLFELEPVAGKKVTVDFSAPELYSLGGLVLVREYERNSGTYQLLNPQQGKHCCTLNPGNLAIPEFQRQFMPLSRAN